MFSVLIRTTPVAGLPPIVQALVVDHPYRALSCEGMELDKRLARLCARHGYQYSGASLTGPVVVTVPTEDDIRPTAEDVREIINQIS